jgi:hypothetical protein
MAADAVDDPVVVGTGVGVSYGGIDLVTQQQRLITEMVAEHDEAEGGEVIDLSGGEHFGSSSMVGWVQGGDEQSLRGGDRAGLNSGRAPRAE